MIDSDGDENYVPFLIPLSGGFPQPLAPESFAGRRSHLVDFDPKTSVAYFAAESREQSLFTALRVHLDTGEVEAIGESMYGAFVVAWSPDHRRAILADEYTVGDTILYEPDGDGRRLWYGTPRRGAHGGGRVPAERHALTALRRERTRAPARHEPRRGHGQLRLPPLRPPG